MADIQSSSLEEELKRKNAAPVTPVTTPVLPQAKPTPSSMADRIRTIQSAPVTPVSAPVVEAIPTPAEEDNGDSAIARALIGLAPALLGGAIGGAEGGAAGAKAGLFGLQDLDKQVEALDKKKAAEAELLAKKTEKEDDRKFQLGLQDRKDKLELAKDQRTMNKEQMAQASNIRKERNALPTTKDTQTVVNSMAKIEAAAKDPTAAGDMALIFSYMKVLDPGSVVRESEYASAKNATGVDQQIRNKWNELKDGKILGDAERSKMRKEFVSRARSLTNAQLKKQEVIDNQFSKIARQNGIDPSHVLINFTDMDAAPLELLISQKRRGIDVSDEQLLAALERESGAQAGVPIKGSDLGIPGGGMFGTQDAVAADPILSVDPSQMSEEQLDQMILQLNKRNQ